MIDKETKEAVPVTAFINAEKLSQDIARVNDAARGKYMTMLGAGLALLANYKPEMHPPTSRSRTCSEVRQELRRQRN